jgi:ABC-type transport system involved in multi-copper enzyme maturation permease subunit
MSPPATEATAPAPAPLPGRRALVGAWTVAGYAIQESLRRRVFVVVLLLSIGFLALFAWGASAAFDEVRENLDFGESPVRATEVAGGILLGLAMFAILFLGAVLAVFLTLGAVRGDAERGLLQPILVRPISRSAVLAGRFLAAAVVCAAYVVAMFLAAAAITRWAGDWWPDRVATPALGLAAAVTLIAALAVLGSVFLSGTANGIAVFMLFGAGLVGGLLGQIGDNLPSERLARAGEITSWALPFEALYQNALYAITADAEGFERVIVELGPFGGAQSAGPALWLWSAAYLVGVGALAAWAFARRDL